MTGCGYKGKYIKRINRRREGGVKKRLEETSFKTFGRFDVINYSEKYFYVDFIAKRI